MEFCRESLFQYIEKRNLLVQRRNLDSLIKDNEKQILKTFSSICCAVNYLHSDEKIIHRDLRPKNIYISEEGKFKIGDFGLATDKKLSKKINSMTFTRIHQDVNSAPEQLKDTFKVIAC